MMQRSLSILLALVVPLLMIQAANAQTFTYTPRLQILDGRAGSPIPTPQSSTAMAGAIIASDDSESADMLFLGISIDAERTGGSGPISFESMSLIIEFRGSSGLDTESFLTPLRGADGWAALGASAEWERTLPDDQTTLDRPTPPSTEAAPEAIIGRVPNSLRYSIVFDDGLNRDNPDDELELRAGYCPATGEPPTGGCNIPIGTLVVDMRSVPFDSTGTLTVALVDLDNDSIVPFGLQTGTATASTSVDTDLQIVEYAITSTRVDFSVTPDVDGDGDLDDQDALVMYLSYNDGFAFFRGNADGRLTLFGAFATAAGGGITPEQLLENANEWRTNGGAPGDLDGVNGITDQDALVMYLSYHPSLRTARRLDLERVLGNIAGTAGVASATLLERARALCSGGLTCPD